MTRATTVSLHYSIGDSNLCPILIKRPRRVSHYICSGLFITQFGRNYVVMGFSWQMGQFSITPSVSSRILIHLVSFFRHEAACIASATALPSNQTLYRSPMGEYILHQAGASVSFYGEAIIGHEIPILAMILPVFIKVFRQVKTLGTQ